MFLHHSFWKFPLPFSYIGVPVFSVQYLLSFFIYFFVWWSTSSDIFLINDEREVKFLRLCMSKNIFFLIPSSLIDSLAGYLILVWKCFTSEFWAFFPLCLQLPVWLWKSSVTFWFLGLSMWPASLFLSFSPPPLSLWDCAELDWTMSLYIYLLTVCIFWQNHLKEIHSYIILDFGIR